MAGLAVFSWREACVLSFLVCSLARFSFLNALLLRTQPLRGAHATAVRPPFPVAVSVAIVASSVSISVSLSAVVSVGVLCAVSGWWVASDGLVQPGLVLVGGGGGG